MKNLIYVSDFSKDEVFGIFNTADRLREGTYLPLLKKKTIVMFFPSSSIRTRVSFEKGIYLLGGQVILFPTETLDKKEALKDVMGYLNNWADLVVVRHKNIELLHELAHGAKVPIINAMTALNHPCEVLSDLYGIKKRRATYLTDKYLFVGGKGNIAGAWQELASFMSLDFIQSCPQGYEQPGFPVVHDICEALKGRDIICTDSLPGNHLKDFERYQITAEKLKMANPKVLLNPCPPFYRGEEVSQDAIESQSFVGYSFKSSLLEIQQAIILHLLGLDQEV